jgi:hypothetical protein
MPFVRPIELDFWRRAWPLLKLTLGGTTVGLGGFRPALEIFFLV